MNKNVQLKNMAINLRKEGRSYSEIVKELGLAKSTLSNWLKGIVLTEQQNIDLYNRLEDKISRGRLRTSIALKAKRIVRENRVYTEAEREFKKYIQDPFFVIGISLYWAEGSKKDGGFSFINSDPNMIVLIVKWIKKYVTNNESLLKYRLFIHYPYKDEKCEEYWAELLNVSINNFQKTIYKPTPHIVKKNPIYKGCLRIVINRIDMLRKVIAWQKLLIQYYDKI